MEVALVLKLYKDLLDPKMLNQSEYLDDVITISRKVLENGGVVIISRGGDDNEDVVEEFTSISDFEIFQRRFCAK
ncbi:MAG: hypothetical protein AMXMBFR82_52920 [Candidatus Hydrogenedentota bacterium]